MIQEIHFGFACHPSVLTSHRKWKLCVYPFTIDNRVYYALTTCVCACACVRACVRACMRACMCICVCGHVGMHVGMCACEYVCAMRA